MSFFSQALEVGLALLDLDSCWDQHYDWTLKLMSTLAHMQYYCRTHEVSRRMPDEVFNHTRYHGDKLDFTVR
jgi:hypothetical protein